MDPQIAARIEDIRGDRSHGAGWLSREALGVLGLAAGKSQARDVAQFLEELNDVAARLIETRLSMASIANCISRFIYEVQRQAKGGKGLDWLRGFALATAEGLVRDSLDASLKASQQGAKLIENGDRVMTCSYSSTICRAFTMAKGEGKQIEVIALESGGYSEATATELAPHGIPVRIIADDSLREHISTANKAMVGADSVLGDGSVVNGSPSYPLALAAKEAGIAFYCVCETSKFQILNHRRRLEEGFDLIPPHLITAIVTEGEMIKPGRSMANAKQREGFIHILSQLRAGGNSSA